ILIKTKSSEHFSEYEAIESIRGLALINCQLNRLTAFPFAIFILALIIDSIASICLSAFVPNTESYLHFGVTLLYVIGEICFSATIQRTLKQIGNHFRNRRNVALFRHIDPSKESFASIFHFKESRE